MLTVEKLAAAAKNFTVMLMVTDASTAHDLLHHWLGNVQAAGIGYYLIAAADDATSQLLVERGLQERCYRLAGTSQQTQSTGYVWASEPWKDATWRKVPAAQQLLALGYNVLLSDIDVMWLADPLPYLTAVTPEADFLISLDGHHTDKPPGDEGLEAFQAHRMMNTGVYYARARIQVLDMYREWLSYRRANHDQDGFKLMTAAGGLAEKVPGQPQLGRMLGGRLVVGHLPLSSFMHSYTFSVMQLHKLAKTPPFEVHMVFGYGHAASKIYKLRDAGLGHDPLDSEYYNPPGGLLSFDLVPPRVPPGFSGWAVEDLSYTEDDMEVAHNRAIDHQLQQLYHALGLALALNRTLLMPAMSCLCVRGWFPNEACRLPGDSRSSLPFHCTGDQVFDIEGLMHPNISVAGSLLRVRPPGFATDSRLPPTLQQQQQGRLTVTPGLPACKAVVRNAIWQQRRLAQFEQLQLACAVVATCTAEQQQATQAKAGASLARPIPATPLDSTVLDSEDNSAKRGERAFSTGRLTLAAPDAFEGADTPLEASYSRNLAQSKPSKPKEAKVSDAASISFKRLEKGYAVQGRKLAQTKPSKPKDAKVSDAASISFKRLEKGYAVQSQGRKLAQTKPGKPKEAKVLDAASISFKRLEKGYAVRP
ncbi:hypothetical protein OEZ85_011679 [Tetradesmus obliquus]|uniref:Nucleotide-diphospho-sugar transferase domain-containing protein n=1 Tax=Tetradesmus obliquus TaxID=3088 RepID=A0ABY8TT77_TETOB|nr:hypothetical protein OEZ85_011679 [Tetradesmus obliquus]